MYTVYVFELIKKKIEKNAFEPDFDSPKNERLVFLSSLHFSKRFFLTFSNLKNYNKGTSGCCYVNHGPKNINAVDRKRVLHVNTAYSEHVAW